MLIPLGGLRAVARGVLADLGVRDAHFEADQIVGHVLALPRAYLHAHPERAVAPAEFSKIVELTVRRCAGEPLAYVLGSAFFRGRAFAVDRRVLIPRPETEALASWADRFAKSRRAPGVFADWCTGSGCVAVALLLDNPGWRAYAADASAGALEAARRNARDAGVEDRVTFIHCSRPSKAARTIPDASLDFIVANPPYIPTETIPSLELQVRGHEPREALDGGPDGLGVCRLLLEELPRFLKPGAPLALETGGPDQVARLEASARRDLAPDGTFKDDLGIRRFIVWRKRDRDVKIES